MQLYAVKFGASMLAAKYMYRDRPADSDEALLIPWSYYIAKRDGQTYLFDVGFRDEETAAQWGIQLFDVKREVASLLGPANVDTIVITHSHFDHIGNIDLFPDARVIIGAEEHRTALLSGGAAVAQRLMQDNVTIVEQELLIDNKFKFSVVGGHTSGSAVVYFEQDQRRYVLTGDECYTSNNLTANRPIGIYASAERNERFLEAAGRQGLVPLPCHDESLYEQYTRLSEHIVQIV